KTSWTSCRPRSSTTTRARQQAPQRSAMSLHSRRKLEVAMRYVLDGTVTPPDTKLTWKNVAAVAGVSKATADRAIDLRDEFRQQIEQRVPPPVIRPQLRLRSRGDADDEVARLRREHAELKE